MQLALKPEAGDLVHALNVHRKHTVRTGGVLVHVGSERRAIPIPGLHDVKNLREELARGTSEHASQEAKHVKV